MTVSTHPASTHSASPHSVSAHTVAAVLRGKIPGLTTLKLHTLLYYSQAHHLAATGRPLFSEAVVAWDMGPVVAQLWRAERDGVSVLPQQDLSDGARNIVDYVISRYGKLSGVDLAHLTHAEDPWLLADRDRPAGGNARIRDEWMRDYFRSDELHDEGEVWFTREKVATLTAGAAERLRAMPPAGPDETNVLRAKLDELKAQLSA